MRLHVFNVRQLQENVVRKSATMAVSSLLILGALCCFGAGVSISVNYGQSESHVLDYTFIPEYTDGPNQEKTAEDILDTLHKEGLDTEFSRLFKMKIGDIRTTDILTEDDFENAYSMDDVMEQVAGFPASDDKDVLLNTLSFADYPYLISLSGYNELLRAAGASRDRAGER